MPAVLGIQLFVHLVLLGHEQVQEPVFLLVHQAQVPAGALIAGQDSLLVPVVAHGFADLVLNGLMLNLIAVLVILLVGAFGHQLEAEV